LSGGLVFLILGGRWIVNGAITTAQVLGVSEAVIALTVVSVGTSLPELATSVAAARKGNSEIAVGNAVGSNIFNVFFVLAISSIIRPIPFHPIRNLDISIAILAGLLLFIWMFTGKRSVLDRWEGWVLVAIYAGYIALLTCLNV
jgi:cation:H+ antiporter